MELRHTLQKAGGTETTIEEPIGFDKMKSTISRGDYHGISAAVSVDTLEFYGKAAEIVKSAYEANIDTEVIYRIKTTSGALFFQGTLDLSTCAEHSGDYCSISCKVGEVGAKTTFNNRTATEVDLNDTKDVDGRNLAHTYQWLHAKIPARDIVYRNEYLVPEQVVWDQNTAQAGEREAYRLVNGKEYQWINVPLATLAKPNEFGQCEPNAYIPDLGDSSRNGGVILNNNGEYCTPLFAKGQGFDAKFGAGSTYTVKAHLKIKLEALDNLFNNKAAPSICCANASRKFVVALMFMNGETTMENAYSNSGGINCTNWQVFSDGADGNTYKHSHTFELDINKSGLTHQALYLGFLLSGYNIYDDCATWHEAFNEPARMRVTIDPSSWLKMTLDSKQTESPYKTDMIPVHEALSKTAEMISGLTVRSDYYGRMDSSVNPIQTPAPWTGSGEQFMACFGPGSLKALTNGYKIRDLFTTGDEQRNMVVSFKKLIESLDAQDCIGWGFETENGQTYIRVEPWSWFYKDDVLMRITNPTKKDRTVNVKAIISELNIGYKKYTTEEDLNSTDSIHGERTFTGGIKAVSGAKKKLCEFVADNYAIELTRRKGLERTNDEYKHDETIFVLELTAKRSKSGTTATYSIEPSLSSGGYNLAKPSQTFNAIISPRRMAERWRAFLFQTNSPSAMRLTSGTVNYKAYYATKPQSETNGSVVTFRLQDPKGTATTYENGQLTHTRCKMKAETLKVEYPVTLAQYQTILANPMGIIEVDGEKCWIHKFTYDFNEGTAEFELIPKYV